VLFAFLSARAALDRRGRRSRSRSALRSLPARAAACRRTCLDGRVDFGIIVDGAVILVEHLSTSVGERRRRSGGAPRTRGEVLRAADEVARPTLFSLLIIIAAYIPIFSLAAGRGRIFAPMANTVVSALVGRAAVSFTLVPCSRCRARAEAARGSRRSCRGRASYAPLARSRSEPGGRVVLALGAALALG
jgi:cobalt-zinc-cadmium resistance protein CzcA